ncbi:FAD-binding oxidoreductase [Pseudomonas aeruginosa]
MTNATLLEALREQLGPRGLLVGAEISVRRATFWDSRPLSAAAILRPSSPEQLCNCLRLCHAAGQSLIPLGGNTGLVEGTACGPTDILLSLERLNRIECIDPVSQTVTVQAGVVLQALQERLAERQWMFPVDLGARGSCTLGGMIATNAGGFGVLAHGMMREQVLGLEVALADGSLLSSMQSFTKNNTGYDLKQLFIGSEGTLGVITRATLRIKPARSGRTTAMVGVGEFDQLVRLLQVLQCEGNGLLTAFEVMWPDFWELNTGPDSPLRSPLADRHNYYVLLEFCGASLEDTQARCEQLLEQALEQGLAEDAVLARSCAEQDSFWAIREAYEVEQRSFARTQGYDVSLAIADMPMFVEHLTTSLRQLQEKAVLLVFGHLADGNLHLTIGLHHPTLATDLLDALVYQTLARFGGSISAEHGIGLERKAYLPLSRNAQELYWMRQLKQLLDPHGLLNPGKVLDL